MTIIQQIFKGMYVDALIRDTNKIDWTPLYSADFMDDIVELFTAKLTTLYDDHAPIQEMRVKHRPSPWPTEDIKS